MSEGVKSTPYCLPNRMARILLMSMREVMGHGGLNAILNTARLPYSVDTYPPADFDAGLTCQEVNRLMEAVEGIYGVRSGRRLARHSGRYCFRFGIEGLRGVIGVADFFLRFLPLVWRVRLGLEVLMEILGRYTAFEVSLVEDEVHFLLELHGDGQVETQGAAGALIAGLVEEVLYWVSRGRHFIVEDAVRTDDVGLVRLVRVAKSPIR